MSNEKNYGKLFCDFYDNLYSNNVLDSTGKELGTCNINSVIGVTLEKTK
ncbi:MAG: hypothetical protein IJH12_10115 [Clostridia bacterium]|nr:hypothetical protein [Clostridia bacterium]